VLSYVLILRLVGAFTRQISRTMHWIKNKMQFPNDKLVAHAI